MRSRKPASSSPLRSNNRSTRGIALVAVLWAVMLLALMAQSFTTDVRTGTQLTQNLVANAEARALADAAVHAAIGRLLSERSDANRAYDGSPYRTNIGGAEVDIAVQDENGKIDLKSALTSERYLLERVIMWAGLTSDSSRAVVDAIADWQDPDSLRRLNGAEESDYRQTNRGYGPKNHSFDSIEELRLVLGITPTLFERIRPAITVYSPGRGFDPRVAPPTVLAAILDDGAQAKAYLEARRDGAPMPDLPKTSIRSSRPYAFTIRATAKSANGARFTREAVVRLAGRSGRPFSLLAWRRGASPNP